MLTLGVTGVAKADQVIQVAVEALLNARAVTTLTGGQLVPWTVGVDGGGLADGYMTAAASRFHNDPATLKALPDDGKFPADARHPEVVLHFSNDAPVTSQQTHYVRGAGNFSFAVPPATYSEMFLFVTSAEGSSTLHVSMTYADTTEAVDITVPDYFTSPPANDPVVFNLASDLPKWTQQNVVAEMNHHNLTGLELRPVASKVLNTIQVDKTAPGYLVFWGATGIATGVETDGGDASPDAPPSGDAQADVSHDVIVGSGAGGATGAAGATTVGTGGSSGESGAAGQGRAPAPSANDAGCACRLGSGSSTGPGPWGVVMLLGTLARRRRYGRLSAR